MPHQTPTYKKKKLKWPFPSEGLTEKRKRTKMMDGKLFRCYYDTLINNKDETEGARDSQGAKWWFTPKISLSMVLFVRLCLHSFNFFEIIVPMCLFFKICQVIDFLFP